MKVTCATHKIRLLNTKMNIYKTRGIKKTSCLAEETPEGKKKKKRPCGKVGIRDVSKLKELEEKKEENGGRLNLRFKKMR